MMGFRTQHPEICQLDISNVLSWRNLRKWHKQEGHSDLPPHLFSLEQVVKCPCERCPPWPGGGKTFFLPKKGSLGLRDQYKPTFLNSPCLATSLGTPSSPGLAALSVLHRNNFTVVSLPERYGSFWLWTGLQVSILSCRFAGTCKSSTQSVRLSCVNPCQLNFSDPARDAIDTSRVNFKIKCACKHTHTPFDLSCI